MKEERSIYEVYTCVYLKIGGGELLQAEVPGMRSERRCRRWGGKPGGVVFCDGPGRVLVFCGAESFGSL